MSTSSTNAPIVHLDPDQRVAIGRSARAAVRRSSHAEWVPSSDRPDPTTLLTQQEVTRVDELVPLRHERMLVSPFTFYRGAAVVMASDLASQPDSGLRVQACGDAHLSNFGGFASPERDMIFDVNDFDETLPAPWEWDVKRLAASFVVASRSNGFSARDARAAAAACGRSYREHMAELAADETLDRLTARADAALLDAKKRRSIQRGK